MKDTRYRIAVAPMMDCTDRHDRYLLRLISRRVRLYTEMVTTGALLHGDPERLLAFHPVEHPVALQLGGSNPGALAECAGLAEARGYDEVNLNLGCPSDRVQAARFGACLMKEPEHVADCVAAIRRAVTIPVTVKTRIGVDDRDDYNSLYRFVAGIADAGCSTVMVHARKAWLMGLSPRENREVPPLRYEMVYRLKRDLPGMTLMVNGGIRSLDEAEGHLARVDGVMLGRAVYHDPYLLAPVDTAWFGDPGPPPARHAVLERYLDYCRARLAEGEPLAPMARHLLGLYQGIPGARAWRRRLSEGMRRRGAGVEVIREAARHLHPEVA